MVGAFGPRFNPLSTLLIGLSGDGRVAFRRGRLEPVGRWTCGRGGFIATRVDRLGGVVAQESVPLPTFGSLTGCSSPVVASGSWAFGASADATVTSGFVIDCGVEAGGSAMFATANCLGEVVDALTDGVWV